MDEEMKKALENIETFSIMSKSVGEDFINASKEAEKMLDIFRDPFKFMMHAEDIDKHRSNMQIYLMMATHKATTLSEYLKKSNDEEGGKDDE